jgi:type III secretion protein D
MRTSEAPDEPGSIDPELELRVLSGIHQGAALLLVDDGLVVGSDPDGDVVLLDEGVQPRHLRVVRHDGGWFCEGADGAVVTSAEGHSVEGRIEVTRALRLQIASVWLAFCALGDPWDAAPSAPMAPSASEPLAPPASSAIAQPPRRTSKRGIIAFVAGSLLMCCVFAGIFLAIRGNAPEQVVAVKQAAPPPPMPQRGPAAEVLHRDAQAALNTQQLGGLVKVGTKPGFLRIDGELTPPEITRFEQALQELQNRYGATTRIEASIKPLSYALPFRIRQVLMGVDSHVVLDSGEEVFEGARIGQFRLVSIRAGKVVFFGPRTVEVTW